MAGSHREGVVLQGQDSHRFTVGSKGKHPFMLFILHLGGSLIFVQHHLAQADTPGGYFD